MKANENNYLTISLVICLLAGFCVQTFAQNIRKGNDSKPLLTIGCITDLHCEYDCIDQDDPDNVRLRESTVKALNAIKDNENVDILFLGGDYTSQTTTTYENWKKSRELLVDATRSVFNGADYTPVVYVNGNHEYEAPNVNGVPKPWNSGDYYSFPMKEDLGKLSSDDCFYEDADNGFLGKMSLLAAYHYKIKGIDVVVLNTAKHLFASSGNYYYSKESVDWCDAKIASLYAENPDRTIFFLAHIPFSDSNSLSSSSKGMPDSQPGTQALRTALAKYPNLIMLYGHDHGSDKAYIRDKTSQRITRYSTEGKVMSAFDKFHVDGTEVDEDYSDEQPTTGLTSGTFYLKNIGTGTYLGGKPDKIGMSETPVPVEVRQTNATSYQFTTNVKTDGGSGYLSCGGSGMYNLKGSADSGEQGNGYWYKVTYSEASNTITATKSSTLDVGSHYLIIHNYNGYYALGSTVNEPKTKPRMQSYGIATLEEKIELDNTDNAIMPYIYTIESVPVTPPTPSYFSVFMGSMRYYNNSIEGSWQADNYTSDRRIIQGLMIYVYNDRIVFQMKNYGESGTVITADEKGEIEISETPEPYTVFRDITLVPDHDASTISMLDKESKEWEFAELSPNNTITIDESLIDGIDIKRNTMVNGITYERKFIQNIWQPWYMPFDMTLTDELLDDFTFAKIAGALSDEDGNKYIAFVRMKADEVVKANTPYVIKPLTAATTMNIGPSKLIPSEEEVYYAMSMEQTFTFQGITTRKYASEDDNQWFAMNSKGCFIHPTSTASVGPLRFFLTITERDDNPYSSFACPPSINIKVIGDDLSTDIKNATVSTTNQIYDLMGHLRLETDINSLPHGIYIINGKKILR